MEENIPSSQEPEDTTSSTPPPPVLTGKPLVEEPTFTPHRWLDYSLGIFSIVVGLGLALIGLLIPLALYFILRAKYPIYARGIIHGFIGLGVLLLGAFTVCVVGAGGC